MTLTLERAREEAKRAEQAYKDGTARPLEGLTLAVKDLYDTEGVATTYGSSIFKGHVPKADAYAVRRAKRRGRDRRRQDAHARVRVGHHVQQPALPALPQPVGPGADPGRVLRRQRRRARHGPARARARHRHRRLDPHPRRVLRRLRPQADLQPDPGDRRLPARPLARPRRPDGAHPADVRLFFEALTGSRAHGRARDCARRDLPGPAPAPARRPASSARSTHAAASLRRLRGPVRGGRAHLPGVRRRSSRSRPRSPTPRPVPLPPGRVQRGRRGPRSSARGRSRSPSTSRRPRPASASARASRACSPPPTCC